MLKLTYGHMSFDPAKIDLPGAAIFDVRSTRLEMHCIAALCFWCLGKWEPFGLSRTLWLQSACLIRNPDGMNCERQQFDTEERGASRGRLWITIPCSWSSTHIRDDMHSCAWSVNTSLLLARPNVWSCECVAPSMSQCHQCSCLFDEESCNCVRHTAWQHHG